MQGSSLCSSAVCLLSITLNNSKGDGVSRGWAAGDTALNSFGESKCYKPVLNVDSSSKVIDNNSVLGEGETHFPTSGFIQ